MKPACDRWRGAKPLLLASIIGLSGCAGFQPQLDVRPMSPAAGEPARVSSPAPKALQSRAAVGFAVADPPSKVRGRAVEGLEFNAVPLDAVVRELAKVAELGAPVVAPGDYPAVTVRFEERLEPAALVQRLASVAAAHGATLVQGDGVVFLAKAAEAGHVTRMIPVRHRLPSEMRPMIADGDGRGLRAMADDRARVLVVYGPAGAVAEAEAVVASLDQEAFAGLEYRFVGLSRAGVVAPAVGRLLPPSVSLTTLGDGVLLAGPAADLDRVAQVLGLLDRQAERVVYTYRTSSLDPAKCAEMVSDQRPAAVGYSSPAYAAPAGDSFAPSRSAVPSPAAPSSGPPGQNSSLLSGAPVTASNAAAAFQAAYPSAVSSVSPAAPDGLLVRAIEGACVMRGTPAQVADAVELLRAVDPPPVRVYLEAALFEATVTDGLQMGVRTLLTTGGAPSVGTVDNGDFASVAKSAAFAASGVVSFGSVKAVIDAVASKNNGQVRVLSSPSVWVDVGKQARLSAGERVPVASQYSTSLESTRQITSVQYQDTGVLLTVTPEQRDGSAIRLRITQEVSDALRTTTSGIDSPTISRRAVDTVLTLRDGQTALLGGLLRETVEDGTSGVPGLSDLPGIGGLFRVTSNRREVKDLALVITPRVVDDTAISRAAGQVLERIARLRAGRSA